jgi:hypothetical protein
MTPKVIAAARRWAPSLHIEPGSPIDPVAALLAIASVESSGGIRWEASKHETSYCYAGRYHNMQLAALSSRWGCAAHCSWSAWQIMYITAVENGYHGDPTLLRDPEIACPYAIAVMNRRVFDRLKGETISDIFDAWNSGNPRDRIIPALYIKTATEAYQRLSGNKPQPETA